MKEKNQIIGGFQVEPLIEMFQSAVKTEMEKLLEECRFGTEWKDEILSRKQAADLFGKTPDKISEMYEKKEIPGFKTGREYFFLKSQLIKVFRFKK